MFFRSVLCSMVSIFGRDVAQNFLRCAKFSVVKFSDDGHNYRFTNPSCGAKFPCRNGGVIPN